MGDSVKDEDYENVPPILRSLLGRPTVMTNMKKREYQRQTHNS
jgi:hypothetical protein